MTLNELASAIYNDIVSGLRGKTDTVISISQIEDECINVYNSLVKKYSLQGLIPINEIVMSLKCIPMECSDISECCQGIDSGTRALKFKLPRPSVLLGLNSITYAGPIDRSMNFQVYTNNNFIYNKYRRWNKRPVIWVDMGNRSGEEVNAYLINGGNIPSLMEYITVDMVVENPYKALKCCNMDDAEFPAPKYIQDEIKTTIVERFIRYYKMANPTIIMPNDQTSNKNA